MAVTFLGGIGTLHAGQNRAVECVLKYRAQVEIDDPDVSFETIIKPFEDTRNAANIYENKLVTVNGLLLSKDGSPHMTYEVEIRDVNRLVASMRNLKTGEATRYIGGTDLISSQKLGTEFDLSIETKVSVTDSVKSYQVDLECKTVKELPQVVDPH